MFFTAAQVAESIASLSNVHPFHGITFLVCKKKSLPIGTKIVFPIDSETDAFLQQYHRIDPESNWFFQPYKSSDTSKKWVRHDYSAKGLQAVNTQTFGNAFIHERNSRIWGWSQQYVDLLEAKLPRKKKIPAFHLAVWIYKDKDWDENASLSDVVNFFIDDFKITEEERKALFDVSVPKALNAEIFQKMRPTWYELRPYLPHPPDAKPDQGGTLAYLETRGLGPIEHLVLEPANRLTLITGDNGLGKTFLLECAWWALTGVWADQPAYPTPNYKKINAEISFAIEGKNAKPERKKISFDWSTFSWPQPKNRPTIPGLTVYARVDGSFAVWDPAKQIAGSGYPGRLQSVYSSDEVWNGLSPKIEGLLRDWIRWQNNPNKYPFKTFIKVLERLSPPDLGPLTPGEPIRIPGDSRDIPTIKHPYGVTPIIYASAGVRRIITLAYLIVWAWNEHVIASELTHAKLQRRMVVLVDEMEAHLHPRWQRAVLPALMTIGEMLSADLEAQFIVATHSPLVMASAEPVFNDDSDALIHLDLNERGEVNLSKVEFVSFGDVSSWLTSPVFELKHARSSEAELAIEEAKALQLSSDASADAVHEVSARLIKYLAQDDKFWPRWIYFAEKFGVQI